MRVKGANSKEEGVIFGQEGFPRPRVRARLFERRAEWLGEARGQRDFLQLQPLGWVGPDCWGWTQESAFVSAGGEMP